jgi:hypothetical protein
MTRSGDRAASDPEINRIVAQYITAHLSLDRFRLIFIHEVHYFTKCCDRVVSASVSYTHETGLLEATSFKH